MRLRDSTHFLILTSLAHPSCRPPPRSPAPLSSTALIAPRSSVSPMRRDCWGDGQAPSLGIARWHCYLSFHIIPCRFIRLLDLMSRFTAQDILRSADSTSPLTLSRLCQDLSLRVTSPLTSLESSPVTTLGTLQVSLLTPPPSPSTARLRSSMLAGLSSELSA